jgi:hypothetical protein
MLNKERETNAFSAVKMFLSSIKTKVVKVTKATIMGESCMMKDENEFR